MTLPFFEISGEVSDTILLQDVNKSHEGTYTCKMWNIAGEFTWAESSVFVDDVKNSVDGLGVDEDVE